MSWGFIKVPLKGYYKGTIRVPLQGSIRVSGLGILGFKGLRA